MFAMATGKDIGNPEKNEQFFEVVNKSHNLQVATYEAIPPLLRHYSLIEIDYWISLLVSGGYWHEKYQPCAIRLLATTNNTLIGAVIFVKGRIHGFLRNKRVSVRL